MDFGNFISGGLQGSSVCEKSTLNHYSADVKNNSWAWVLF